MKHKSYRIIAVIVLILLLSGCSGTGNTSAEVITPPPSSIPVITPSPSPTPTITPEPTSAPAPTIAPTEEEIRAARAVEILNSMTIREKVCQMLIIYPEKLANVYPLTVADDSIRPALADLPVGGLLLDRKNMLDRAQITKLTADLQNMSEIPLILTCDEEGGRVNRLMKTVGTTWVGPMLDYKDLGSETAYANAQTIASDLISCGFNTDLAPVADVWSNPENKVIGDRAYSTDFAQAAELVSAAVEGFHAGGAACTLKHFPGHGDTSTDSHVGAVYVDTPLSLLREQELLPFQSGIDAGADAVMLGHLIVSDIDSEPAPFSYSIVTELLRNEMGFHGVIMTDSLEMSAITDYYESGEIALKAVQAGVDILLCPPDPQAAVSALVEAVEIGSISEERLNESVLRILELKLRQGLLT